MPALPIGTGWQARLDMRLAPDATGRTVLAHLSHLGPLRVQRPFYPQDGHCHIYILHPPGGVVGGDAVAIHAHLAAHSHALFTAPGSSKFYKSAGDVSLWQQRIVLEKNASCEWLLPENIFFNGAKAHLNTEIHLHPDSRLLFWEQNCYGLPANQQVLSAGQLFAKLQVWLDGVIQFNEIQRFDAQSRDQRLCVGAHLRGHPLQATLLCYPCDADLLASARAFLQNWTLTGCLYGMTLLDAGLLVVRVLAEDIETIQTLMRALWQHLRPAVLGKPALAPRIWAT